MKYDVTNWPSRDEVCQPRSTRARVESLPADGNGTALRGQVGCRAGTAWSGLHLCDDGNEDTSADVIGRAAVRKMDWPGRLVFVLLPAAVVATTLRRHA